MVIALVALSFGLFLFVELLITWLNGRQVVDQNGMQAAVKGFGPVRLPRGLFVGPGHTWARLMSSGELRVGIDEFLSQALDGADRVELPEAGTEVCRGEPLLTVWRGQRKLVIPSPVDGTVTGSNETAERAPWLLAGDPYGSAWLLSMWPTDHGEALRTLKVGERAYRWLQGEVQRFVEFLARRTPSPRLAAALPDGAHPVVGVALTLDEPAWQEFEQRFVREGF